MGVLFGFYQRLYRVSPAFLVGNLVFFRRFEGV